jgi:aspartate/methionine/tyrosine aminotransferase
MLDPGLFSATMNALALELNHVLEGTSAYRLLSDFGRQIYFPKGIVAQAAEAGAMAKRYDATVGMAVEHREPMMLDCVRSQVPGLSTREMSAYAPTGGFPALRDLWKKQILDKNPDLTAEHFSLPMVVPGLTNGIFQASELFINPGDQVVIPDMCWDNYELLIGLRRQADIRHFPFFSPEGGFNLAGLEELVTRICVTEKRNKLVLLLNFPNNPTGYSPSRAEAEALTALLRSQAERGVDILVICDDAYFGLFYEPETSKQSLFTPLSRCHENLLVVKVDGSTKEDYVWGFRVGFMSFGGKGLSPVQLGALQSKLTGSIRASVSSSSSLAQNIMLRAYGAAGYQDEKQRAFGCLEARYRRVKEIVARGTPAQLKALPFNSGYFMAFRCEGIAAENLRQALLAKGIGTIALQNRYLRVAYASVDIENLEPLFTEIFTTAGELAS